MADELRIAERRRKSYFFHIVRGDRYACGAKRDGSLVVEDGAAYKVLPKYRCQRIGCMNDYAKADKEAR